MGMRPDGKIRGDQREVHNMKREDVLMEALPYIQQFHGKTIVIKLGGHAMVDPVVLENAIRDAVLLNYVGIRVVLVHGGGPEITEKMKQMGKESVFVAGLRVTDEETLEIAQMVLVGKINSNIVSLIAKCGARGVGLSGNDGSLIIARKMDPQKVRVGGVIQEVDLGHVGDIEWIDPAILNTLLENRYIPVVAPIAIDRAGNSLNINADTAAGDIAVALKAYKLINMTDVDGVMDASRTNVFRKLSIDQANRLLKSGAIGEGMIPKVTSVINAVENGVAFAHIINGNVEHNLVLELFTREGVGTMITLK
jgi:acetylglutamate kinase